MSENSVLNFFSFDGELMIKTIKTPDFYENAHLRFFSICLRHYLSSLTEIQYLQIEPSYKGTHTIESMTLKDSSEKQSAFDEL